jgi:hypothetical protein
MDTTRRAKMDEKASTTGKKILVGRPRVPVDFAIVLRMRDEEKMGWSRMAQEYQKRTGQYISRDTIKRRYLEIKAKINKRYIIGYCHIKVHKSDI